MMDWCYGVGGLSSSELVGTVVVGGSETRRSATMDKARKGTSTRKPPEPSDSHADIDDWMRRIMPDLQPLVRQARERLAALQRAER